MKILIIEDNPGDARLVQEMLKEQPDNHTIDIAERVATGLQFLNSHNVDVVLLDLTLPDSSGLTTLARLQDRFSHLPIIVMTSIDDEALAVRAVRQGAIDYLVKGQVDSRLLRHSLVYSVERKRMEQELARARADLETRVKERTVELVHARDELRALSSRIIEIQEEERRSIARELHDQTGQCLTLVKLLLDRAAKSPPEKAAPILREASQQLSEAIGQVRNLSLALRPSMLDDLGLVPALAWLCERVHSQSGLEVKFEHQDDVGTLSPEVSTAAYRIIQEALTNIVRHARASEAEVRLQVQSEGLCLKVKDNGCGFNLRALAIGTSSGLSGMRERAHLLGGSFVVESVPGQGTHIAVVLPISGQANTLPSG